MILLALTVVQAALWYALGRLSARTPPPHTRVQYVSPGLGIVGRMTRVGLVESTGSLVSSIDPDGAESTHYELVMRADAFVSGLGSRTNSTGLCAGVIDGVPVVVLVCRGPDDLASRTAFAYSALVEGAPHLPTLPN